MDRRPSLHQKLKALFDSDPHVYHQGPGNGNMVYPCIVYKLSGMPSGHADNFRYIDHREYELTVIDRDPDSPLREKVAKLRSCRFVRSFVNDNLNHFVFNLNYQ